MNAILKKNINIAALNPLIDLYEEWVKVNQVDNLSADELIWSEGLSENQNLWLLKFIKLWEVAEDFEQGYDELFADNPIKENK